MTAGWGNIETIVYRLLNTINGKSYIGITRCGLSRRKRQHLNGAKRGDKTILAAAIRKYGGGVFVADVLRVCASYGDAVQAEIEFIKKFHPEYNMTKGGEPGVPRIVTAEQKQNISRFMSGRPSIFRGRRHTEITKEILRQKTKARGGWRYSMKPEHYAKCGQTRKERHAAGMYAPYSIERVDQLIRNLEKATAAKKKKVRCITDGQIFDSATDASRHYKISRSNITNVVLGKRARVGGRQFEFYGESLSW